MKALVVVLVAASLIGVTAGAATSGQIVVNEPNVRLAVSFSDQDRKVIESHYKKPKKKKEKGTPPGLAKKGGLPPGLAKRDKLPAGVQGEELPIELERRLSPLPVGYMRLKVGQDLVIVDRKTRVVFDLAVGLGD